MPQSTSYDIFQEIPYEEPTYNAIDGILLPTKSSLGVQVCRFSTFQGTLALQPCINHERQHGIFDALEEYEAGDPVFKEARLWACTVQSVRDLPKECRWVVATIYNFASEMLRPDNSQDFLWKMRAWLLHWYEVIERLFIELDINLTVPGPDWFQRDARPGLDTIHEGSHDGTNGSDGTVVHCTLSPEAPEFIRGSVQHSLIRMMCSEASSL